MNIFQIFLVSGLKQFREGYDWLKVARTKRIFLFQIPSRIDRRVEKNRTKWNSVLKTAGKRALISKRQIQSLPIKRYRASLYLPAGKHESAGERDLDRIGSRSIEVLKIRETIDLGIP